MSEHCIRLIDGVGKSQYLWVKELPPLWRVPLRRRTNFRMLSKTEELAEIFRPFPEARFVRTGERDDAGFPVYRLVKGDA